MTQLIDPSRSLRGKQNLSKRYGSLIRRRALLAVTLVSAIAVGCVAGYSMRSPLLSRQTDSFLPSDAVILARNNGVESRQDWRISLPLRVTRPRPSTTGSSSPVVNLTSLDSASVPPSYEADPLVRRRMVDPTQLEKLLVAMDPTKPVVATIANSAFQAMLLNWLAHVLRSGITNVLIASLDVDVEKLAKDHGVASILLNDKVSKKDFRTDPEAFKHMGSLKTALILSIVETGRDVLMSDTDVAWLRNPTDFLKTSSEMGGTDVLVTTDSVSHTNDVASMKADPFVLVNRDIQGWFRFATPRAREIFGNAYEHAFNTGVLFLRATNETLQFCKDWHDVMRTRGKSQGWDRIWGDQHALNQLMRIDMFPIKVIEPNDGYARHNRVFWTYGRRLRLGILPPSEFANGHMFFTQQIPQKMGIKPYVVHNTFQFHYSPGKILRFREHGLWLLDPDSFYTEGNFLSFDISLPNWVYEQPEGIERHVAAINHYYEATRNALAIAETLGRFLILPKVTCFCDRWWDTLTKPCRAPGGDFDPPYICPPDHFINPGTWGHEAEKIWFRQSTFLESPRVSPEILSSRLVVGIADFLNKSVDVDVLLQPNATNMEVRQTLGGLNNIRVLHLKNSIDAFCRFDLPIENQNFDKKTLPLFRLEWCCAPGHVNYNMSIAPISQRTFEICRRSSPPVSSL